MNTRDTIDRFAVFIPKNDPETIYIARESHVAECEWFDEHVSLKPLAKRTGREKTPPELFPESDIGFINANSSLLTFRKETRGWVGILNNGGEITKSVAEKVCRELNDALVRARGNNP